jgi:hypothetical protein
VLEVAELDVADELVDAELLVAQHLLEAALGVADDDHVGVVELAGVEVAVELPLEQREHLVLLGLGEVGELPLAGELGEVLVPPPHRVPDAVGLGLLHRVGAVDERVGGDLVGGDPGERLGAGGSGPVLGDVLGHPLDRLQDRERQEPEPEAAGDLGAAVAGGGHPAGRVRVLHRLGGDHAPGELPVLALELEVLRLPRPDDGLDGLAPLVAAEVAVDAEGGLLHGRRPPGAPVDAPAGEDVGGGDLLGHPHRRGEAVGHERDPEAEADLLGDLAERPDEDLGRRGVRPALAEVVLDVPRAVEAEPVGEADLLDRLGVGLLLGGPLPVRVLAGPGLRDIDLVQQIELHGVPLSPWIVSSVV